VAVRLNKKGLDHAKALIREGKVVRDGRDDWSEHAPSTEQLSKALEQDGPAGYAKWFLGVDDEHPDDSKAHYKFPYSDLRKVHRCAVISGESRAGQYDYADIREALGDLLKRIDQQ
jgi:hypothetical protein